MSGLLFFCFPTISAHSHPSVRAGGRDGFIIRPYRRLSLALSYQTIWFQQLPPTQVRFLVSPFRMTSTVDLICKR